MEPTMSKLKQALEKAKADQCPAEPAVDRAVESPSRGAAPTPPPEERFDVNPVYCRTNVVQTDPRILMRNRVVSFAHGEEVTDQMKILQAQVLSEMERIPGNTLLITSPNASEGKTVTAINLAISMSYKLDRTVLLIDAHLRSPAVHRYLGFPAGAGLSEYLLREAALPDLFVNPGIEKMVLLPGGKPLANSSELLASPRMEAVVKEMKDRYPDRFLIFDASSLLTGADALVLSRFMDGVLLIVESERTPAKDVERSLELLKDRKILGTVLNKARG
jgi:protein-tyrosine kinase